MQIGRLGVWTWLDSLSAPQAAEFAQRVDVAITATGD